MESKTPREFFEKNLPLQFKPEKAVGIDVIAQVNITGPEGGEWTVTIKDQKLEVKEGNDPSAPLVLKMNQKDFIDLVNEKLSAEKAFFTGKIQFKGSISMALKLKDAGFL
ncbi:MAG: SCP2 sterol-binding domain-containing protein [Candidatus Bathyarchaeota archaeon]|nr:SCP2 sterol-binding domain-containing protein [Candidatus Bathyarchaeota archaeon]